MLMGRGVSSRRLARVWMVLARTRSRDARVFVPSRRFPQGGFLHVDQSAWGGTLVNSLLRVSGLLHRHWPKRVKKRRPTMWETIDEVDRLWTKTRTRFVRPSTRASRGWSGTTSTANLWRRTKRSTVRSPGGALENERDHTTRRSEEHNDLASEQNLINRKTVRRELWTKHQAPAESPRHGP